MASKIKVDEIEGSTGTTITLNHDVAMATGKTLPAASLTGTVADARISTLTASKLTGALPAISGANLTGVQGSTLTTEGATFANYNTITATVASVLASGKNHFLCGTVTVNSPYVWTITGEPLTFL